MATVGSVGKRRGGEKGGEGGAADGSGSTGESASRRKEEEEEMSNGWEIELSFVNSQQQIGEGCKFLSFNWSFALLVTL